MPTYTYKARNLQGKLIKGRMEFSTKAELVEALKKEELLLIDVKEEIPGFKIFELFKRTSLSKTKQIGVKKKSVVEVFQRIKPIDLMSFTLQLSNMLGAGVSLLQSLSTLVQQIANKKFRRIIENVHCDVEAGSSFSTALQVYPEVFSPLFVNMVGMGELTGQLEMTLNKLAEFIEHDLDLKQKVRSALIYPFILTALGFLVVMFITTFVMPKFIVMFKEAGVKLSLPTLVVYGFGQAVKRFWYLFIFGSILFIQGAKSCLKIESVRLVYDHIMLKIPLVGPIAQKVILSRFAMTLGVLVSTGVPLLESLDMVERVVGNSVIAKTIRDARANIGRGAKIADAFKVSGKFPPDIIQMINVGEETGGLDKMLAKVANFYDITVDNAIKTVTAFIEPVFLLIMGILVGFIMFSIFIPLFKMVQVIQI